MLITNAITAWLYALMVAAAPPEKLAAQPQVPGWEESVEQKQARYQQIATDLYEVVYDPTTTPLYAGAHGRERTAVTMLAVAYFESGFAHDVDVGPCYQGPGFRGRCDGGLAASMLQIRIGAGTTREGWTQADLFGDRKKAFSAGLALMRRSFTACRKEPPLAQLAAYAAGVCGSPRGQIESAKRLRLAQRWLMLHPAPKADEAGPRPSAGPESDVRSR